VPLQSGWSELMSADVERATSRYAAAKLDSNVNVLGTEEP